MDLNGLYISKDFKTVDVLQLEAAEIYWVKVTISCANLAP